MADGTTFSTTAVVNTVFHGDTKDLWQGLDQQTKKHWDKLSQASKARLKQIEDDLGKVGEGSVKALQESALEALKIIRRDLGPNGAGAHTIDAFAEHVGKRLASLGGEDISKRFNASFKGGFNIGDDIGDAADGFDKMDSAAERLTKAFKELTANLSGFFDLTEKSLKELIRLEAKYVSESIVGSQGKMAQDKREAEARHDAIMQAEREESRRFQLLKINEQRITVEKNEGQKRQTAELKASLKNQSLATNAYYQQQIVREKESLDRRQAMQRFFFDSLRSTFKTGVGAVDAVWRGMYTSIQAIAKRGEGGLLNLTLNSSKQRNKIFESEQRERQSTMQRFSQKGEGGVLGAVAGTSMAGGQLRNIAAAAGSVFGLGKIFTLGSEFQEQLNVTAALTGATKKEFEDLRKAAIGLGNDITLPGVSAGQAAEAMGNLARSGFSVADSISAAKGVLSLARGAQLDFGVASTIVGKSLNVFGIEAAKATQVSDAFTGALALAPQTINDIQAAVARGGGAFISSQKYADTAKNNMEKFLATTSSLIKLTGRSGEEVGTGLKRFFEVFQNPSKPAQLAINQLSKAAGISKGAGNIMYDAAGKTRKFEEQIFYLKKGVGALGSEQEKAAVVGQIFGSEASGIALALASEAFNLDMTVGQLRRLGDSSKIAAARNEGLKGALDALTSQFETFAILAYEKVNKPLGNIVVAIATVIDKIANGGGAFKMLRQGLMGAAAGLAVLAAAKGAREALTYLRIAMAALMSPIGLLVIAAAAIGAGFTLLYKSSKPFRETIELVKLTIIDFAKTAYKTILPVFEVIGKTVINLVDNALKLVAPIFETILTTAKDVWATVANVASVAVLIVVGAVDLMLSAFKGEKVGGIFGAIGRFAKTAFESLQKGLTTITGFARGVAENIMKAFKEGGIVGVLTLPFKKLKESISGVFKDIDFGKLILSALNGIRTAFAAVGRRIGLIVGSNEFRNTVLIALATLGGIVGSALVGFVQGLADGLQKSELGKTIGGFLKKMINPVELIKAIFKSFTGDAGSIAQVILSGGLLAAIAIVMKKLKDAFSKGSAGFKLGFNSFNSGSSAGAIKELDELAKKSVNAATATSELKIKLEQAFGTGMAGKIAQLGVPVASAIRNIKTLSVATIMNAQVAFEKFKPLAEKAMAATASAVSTGLSKTSGYLKQFAEYYKDARANRKVDAGAIVRQNLGDFANQVKAVARRAGEELRLFGADTRKQFDLATRDVRRQTAALVMAFSGSTIGKKVIEFGKNVVTNLKESSTSISRQVSTMATFVSEKFKSANTKIETSLADSKESAFKKAFDKKVNDFKISVEQFKFDVNKTVNSIGAKLGPIGTRINEIIISSLGKAQDFKNRTQTWVSGIRQELRTAISNGFGKELIGNLPELGGLGLAAGGGLAALIVGESPQAKFAGLTSAIFGVTQAIAVAKAMALEFGAVAGFATGGLMAAFSAAAFVVGIFASNQRKAKKAADELKSSLESSASMWREFTMNVGWSGTTFELEFTKRIVDGSDESAKTVKRLAYLVGLSVDDVVSQFSRGAGGIKEVSNTIDSAIESTEQRLRRIRLAQTELGAVLDVLPGNLGTDEAQEHRLETRLNNLKLLKGAMDSLSGSRKTEMRDQAQLAVIEKTLVALKEENRTTTEKQAGSVKKLSDLYNTLKESTIEAMKAGKDAGAAKNLSDSVDEAAKATSGLFSSLKENKLTLSQALDSKNLFDGAINVRKEFQSASDAMTGIATAVVAAGGSQEEVNKQVDAYQLKLAQNLIAQGANKAEVEAFFAKWQAGYAQVDVKSLGFFLRNQEGIESLGAALNPLRKKFIGLVEGSNISADLQEQVKAFLITPSDGKTIQALLNLGVPQQALEDFIKNPDEKHLKAILDVTVLEQELPKAKTPIDKPVNLKLREDKTNTAIIKKVTTDAAGTIEKPVIVKLKEDKSNKLVIDRIQAKAALKPVNVKLREDKNNATVTAKVKKAVDKPVVAKLKMPEEFGNSIGRARAGVTKPFNASLRAGGKYNSDVSAAASGVSKKVNLSVANQKDFYRQVNSIIDRPGSGNVRINFTATAGNANGSIVKSPLLTWVGEGYKPEVIIPLTKPKRAVELFKQSGLESVLAAGGYGRQAAGPNVSSVVNDKTSNVTVNQTFNVNGDTNLRKASRRASNSGYDLGRQLRGL